MQNFQPEYAVESWSIFVILRSSSSYTSPPNKRLHTWRRPQPQPGESTASIVPSGLFSACLMTFQIKRGEESEFNRLIDHQDYYDHDIYDEHFKRGGAADARYGYGNCGLPIVLYHNSPNNSVALIMSYGDRKFRGLFPRVQRHREMA